MSAFINRRVTQSIFRAFDFGDRIAIFPNLYVVINLRERPEAATANNLSDDTYINIVIG